jgi:hypothetical protein
MKTKMRTLVCHSERNEESTAANVMPRTHAWILRCAQNDTLTEVVR